MAVKVFFNIEIVSFMSLHSYMAQEFMETGTLLNKRRSWRPRTWVENINFVRQSLVGSHTKSIRMMPFWLAINAW